MTNYEKLAEKRIKKTDIEIIQKIFRLFIKYKWSISSIINYLGLPAEKVMRILNLPGVKYKNVDIFSTKELRDRAMKNVKKFNIDF